MLQGSIAKAKLKTLAAARPWAVVTGPAAAVVTTAGRLGWRFVDATTIVTDEGATIDLDLDPPIVVKRQVVEAVRRWRSRRMLDAAGATSNSVDDGNAGFCMGPIRRLLEPTTTCAGWSRAHQAALHSAAVNGQWPQVRLHKAKLADHPHCAVCAAAGIPHEHATSAAFSAEPPMGTTQHRLLSCEPTAQWHDSSMPKWASFRRSVIATARIAMRCQREGDKLEADRFCRRIAEVIHAGKYRDDHGDGHSPVAADMNITTTHAANEERYEQATTGHADLADDGTREWRHSPIRRAVTMCNMARRWIDEKFTAEQWSTAWQAVLSSCTAWAAWGRAMVPEVEVQRNVPPADGTYEWRVRPDEVDCDSQLTYYTDASGVDIAHDALRQFGWAFVAVDDGGHVVAAACGRTPPWVTSVAMAEAWALTKAAEAAPPNATFRCDCLAVVRMLQGDPRRAMGPHSPMARVMRRLFHIFDAGEDTRRVVWMPAHKTKSQVGMARMGNGVLMTECDRRSNEMADGFAKDVAKNNRADAATRLRVYATWILTSAIALNLGHLTWAANHRPDPPHRDTEAKPRQPRGQSAAPAPPRCNGDDLHVDEHRPPHLGGHVLTKAVAGTWRCAVCWTAARTRSALSRGRCGGSIFARWADKEVATSIGTGAAATTHRLVLTGDVAWCRSCGAYSSGRTAGLAKPCRGPPPRGCEFGRHTTLTRLRGGKHPKTGVDIGHDSWPHPHDLVAAAREGEKAVRDLMAEVRGQERHELRGLPGDDRRGAEQQRRHDGDLRCEVDEQGVPTTAQRGGDPPRTAAQKRIDAIRLRLQARLRRGSDMSIPRLSQTDTVANGPSRSSMMDGDVGNGTGAEMLHITVQATDSDDRQRPRAEPGMTKRRRIEDDGGGDLVGNSLDQHDGGGATRAHERTPAAHQPPTISGRCDKRKRTSEPSTELNHGDGGDSGEAERGDLSVNSSSCHQGTHDVQRNADIGRVASGQMHETRPASGETRCASLEGGAQGGRESGIPLSVKRKLGGRCDDIEQSTQSQLRPRRRICFEQPIAH